MDRSVYFSCSLTGGRADELFYQLIVDHLLGLGLRVPTAHLAHPDVMDLEEVVEPADVYRRDIDWIHDCDGMVAEVSTPSHGVGYEIAYALERGKPVLCVYGEGRPVSKMITGNSHPDLTVVSYRDGDHLRAILNDFCSDQLQG